MSAWTYRSSDGKADPKIVPPRPRIPSWKGLSADSEEKREPVSDINTAVVDSLKVLDPNRPIREADIGRLPKTSSKTPELAGIRWLAWRRLVCSSSPSATCAQTSGLPVFSSNLCSDAAPHK